MSEYLESSNIKDQLDNLDLNLRKLFDINSNDGYFFKLNLDVEDKLPEEDFLEKILGIINYLNFICENEINLKLNIESNNKNEIIPDYDLGYLISQIISQFVRDLRYNKVKIRKSLSTELLYGLINYFELSIKGNRADWYDVNKRLFGAISNLCEYDKSLIKIIKKKMEGLVNYTDSEKTKFVDEFYQNLAKNREE